MCVLCVGVCCVCGCGGVWMCVVCVDMCVCVVCVCEY